MKTTYLFLSFTFATCNVGSEKPCYAEKGNNVISVNKTALTLKQRFDPPDGYTRKLSDGFGEYLRNLALKDHGARVHYYNGAEKTKPNVHAAVVNMDIGTKDLQQCADAVMRLRGEYLFHSKQANKIHFNFTNGFIATYSKWKAGYRIKISGNNVEWVHTAQPNDSYQSFRSFMNIVFSYAGTLSLSKEMASISVNEMQIGDVLIEGGSPGHAVIVVDMAEDQQGHKIFILAQSYMPAQDIQILVNPNSNVLSPWYQLDTSNTNILTPEWDFTTNNLKRFRD